MRRKHTI